MNDVVFSTQAKMFGRTQEPRMIEEPGEASALAAAIEKLKEYVEHRDNCELSLRNIWRCPKCNMPTCWDFCRKCRDKGEHVPATWKCTCGLEALLAGVSAPHLEHFCIGCHIKWQSPLQAAELCGECWRKAQSSVLAGVSADTPEKAK